MTTLLFQNHWMRPQGRLVSALLLCLAAGSAQSASFEYSAVFGLCTPTCNSFAALGGPGGATNTTPSVVRGTVQIDVGLNDSFDSSDIGVYTMEVFNATAALAPFDGTNAASGNPLTLTNRVASVTGSGTTDANGDMMSGEIQFRFEIPPFNSNQAVVVFDLVTGDATICILFDALGCIPGSTITATLLGGFSRLADAMIVGAPDVSGNGSSETAWVQRFNGSQITSAHRDTPSQTNAVGSATWYNTTAAVPLKAIPIPDADGLGNPGVAVMASNRGADSATRVEVHAVAGADSPALFSSAFHGAVSKWRPLDMDYVPAFNLGPNGGIAVLAQHNDGRIAAQVKNIEDTATVRIPFFDRNHKAIAMAVGRVGVTYSVAVLARGPNGAIKVQSKFINGGGLRNSSYFNKGWTAINIVPIEAGPGRGAVGSADVFGVLARKFEGGTNRVQIRDLDDGSLFGAGNVDFMASDWTPFDVAVVHGASGAGSTDIAVLGIEAARGRARVEVRSAGGALVSRPIFIPADNTLPDTNFYVGLSLVVTPDADGNGADEIGIFGRNSGLQDRLHLKDSVTGNFVRHILPPEHIVVPPAVTYTADVQPIFNAKCAPCHTGFGIGGHNVGTTYADALQPAAHPSCTGLTVGACTIVRIQSGQMPQGFGCTGDPALDAGNGGCLTQAEQDTVQAWIDGGLPE